MTSHLAHAPALKTWFLNDQAEREATKSVAQEVVGTGSFVTDEIVVCQLPFREEHVILHKALWMMVIPLRQREARLEQLGVYTNPLPRVGPVIRAYAYFKSELPVIAAYSSTPFLLTPDGLRAGVLRRTPSPARRQGLSMYVANIRASDAEQFATNRGDFVVRTKGRTTEWKLFSHRDREEYMFHELALEQPEKPAPIPLGRFDQFGTATGRTSSAKPNLANIPRPGTPKKPVP